MIHTEYGSAGKPERTKEILESDIGLGLPRYKRVKKAARSTGPESILQQEAELYAVSIGLIPFHLPEFLMNAAFRRRAMSGAELGAALRASQKVKGFPDLILFYRGHFRAVELKTQIGKLSQAQRYWLKILDGVCIRDITHFKAHAMAFKMRCDNTLKILNQWKGTP